MALPETLGDDTEMPSMLKCAFETEDMLLIIRVGVIEFLEDLGFFSSRYVPIYSLASWYCRQGEMLTCSLDS